MDDPKPSSTDRVGDVEEVSAAPEVPTLETPPDDDGEPLLPPDRADERSRATFLVVGVGASAGGVEALTRFFEAVLSESRLSFVVIQHQDPTMESHMVSILRRAAELPVEEVEDGLELEPGKIYVGRPDLRTEMVEERFVLRERIDGRAHRIDRFLESLAENRGRRAAAVILSGSGSDGSAGLRRIKELGGLVLAQDPETASFSGMPASAISTHLVDQVLDPAEMPAALQRYAGHSYVKGELPREEDAEGGLNQVLAVLRTRKGRELKYYRRATLVRRLQRRMGLRHLEDVGRYAELLREEPDEVEALVRDFMINVSGFFRDAEAWEELRERVLAPLVRQWDPARPLRAWVVGCATGEEAYTLAMLLYETAEDEGINLDLKIFASDVVDDVLDSARSGVYTAPIAEDVSRQRLKRFFLREGKDHYRVNPMLRETVVFASHDLLHHPPFSRLDLVTCRNLLIYLKPEVQKKVLALLHFALREDGYLFLGSSESVGEPQELFEPLSKKRRIYRRLGPTRHDLVEFPLAHQRDVHHGDGGHEERSRRVSHLSFQVRQALVERFAPAAVLIDRRQNVLYFHGDTDPFLGSPPGEPTRHLVALAREGLRTRLRGVVHRALAEKETAVGRVRVAWAGEDLHVTIRAQALEEPQGTCLVTFEARPVAESPEAKEGDRESADVPMEMPAVEVEQELRRTQEELRSTVEELETSNEELKASNEEISSMNEELQSTNEELETSKEELQSLNEELETVNHQLQAKVEELQEANNDISNLLNSTDIATLFLDRKLRIRRFTPAVRRLLDVLPSDTGRPLDNLAWKFSDDELLEDAREVLATLVPREREIRSDGKRTYIRRVVPYRTESDRIEGIVITFTDITRRVAAEKELADLNRDLEATVEARTRQMRILQDTAVISNRARSVAEASTDILQRIGRENGWEVGHALQVDEEGKAAPLRRWWFDESWAGEDGADREAVVGFLDSRTFAPGEGLVGRVLESGEPLWETAEHGLAEHRPGAVELGFGAALAFPVKSGEDTVGVLEFLATKALEPESLLLEVMQDVGVQLGRVVEREEAERRMMQLVQEEQQRLGTELHDTVGQQVTGVAMLVETVRADLEEQDGGQFQALSRVVDELERLHGQVQGLSWTLVSLEVGSDDLEEALLQLCRQTERRGVPCVLEIDDSLPVEDKEVSTSLFRIAREAVHNAALHGRPERVEIHLRADGGRLRLEVRDDGRGMEEVPWHEGLGLTLMSRRARGVGGELHIESSPGQGTRVLVDVPRRRHDADGEKREG